MQFDFKSRRMFVPGDFSVGATIEPDRDRTNYLVNVLRLRPGDTILVFNGRDGEWRARLAEAGRRSCRLEMEEQVRTQTSAPDIHYLFAPLKHARLDYMVQKAVEMGAGRLTPVVTRFVQVARVNRARMEANAIEAAEQCGLLSVPAIDEPVRLAALLDGWAADRPGRRIVFCDEAAGAADPLAILARLPRSPLAVLVGPEGGFAAEERDDLLARPFVTALPLGPRILRADTAAVAALALIQAALGDWRGRDGTPA